MEEVGVHGTGVPGEVGVFDTGSGGGIGNALMAAVGHGDGTDPAGFNEEGLQEGDTPGVPPSRLFETLRAIQSSGQFEDFQALWAGTEDERRNNLDALHADPVADSVPSEDTVSMVLEFARGLISRDEALMLLDMCSNDLAHTLEIMFGVPHRAATLLQRAVIGKMDGEDDNQVSSNESLINHSFDTHKQNHDGIFEPGLGFCPQHGVVGMPGSGECVPGSDECVPVRISEYGPSRVTTPDPAHVQIPRVLYRGDAPELDGSLSPDSGLVQSPQLDGPF